MSVNETIPGRQLSPAELTPENILKVGARLLDHFEVGPSPTEQPEQFLSAIEQLNPRFVGGRDLVRWQLEEDQTEWRAPTTGLIMWTSKKMRLLIKQTPLVGDFDFIEPLGAARQANLDRLRFTASAIMKGKAKTGLIVTVGIARPLNPSEQDNTANYAPGAKTEFDLVSNAARVVAQENPGLVTSQLFVNDEKAGNDAVMEAALDYARDKELLTEDSRVAVVTTQIYQPAASLDLARIAKKYDVHDTLVAGNPSNPAVVANRTPATYLSETLRTIRAAVNAQRAEK